MTVFTIGALESGSTAPELSRSVSPPAPGPWRLTSRAVHKARNSSLLRSSDFQPRQASTYSRCLKMHFIVTSIFFSFSLLHIIERQWRNKECKKEGHR